MGKGSRHRVNPASETVGRERTDARERTIAQERAPTPEQIASRLAVALAALGAWTTVVPFLGHAIGFGVDVASTVEVVDHVVPGTAVAVTGGYLLTLTRRRSIAGQWPAVLGGGLCFLAGWWVLATHVSLLVDASHGKTQWGTALWHASTALPIVIVSLSLVLQRQGDDGESEDPCGSPRRNDRRRPITGPTRPKPTGRSAKRPKGN